MADYMTTTAPWGPQQPFLEYGFNQARGLYNTGGPQYYPNSTVAQYGNTTNQAMNMYLDQAQQGQVPGAANAQSAATLGGQYLPGQQQANPYLDAMYNNAAGAVTRNYQEAVAPGIQSQFANAGRTGSGMLANAMDQSRDTLSRNLGGMAANIYGGAYENERGRQMQALNMAPQTAQLGYLPAQQTMNVGNLQDAKAQENITDQFNRYQFNQERPWDALGRYSNLIQGSYGTTSAQPQYQNSLAQNIGLGLGGLRAVQSMGGLGGILSGLGLN